MVGVRELPQATRPDTVWACLLHPYNRACDAWCRDRACGARDRIVAAWPSWAADRSPQPWSKATTQGDEVRIVVDRTRCVGMGICEGIDPERFQVQSDGKSSAPKGNLEDDEVLEVAREAGSGI
jgi:ferredoxin